MQVRLHTVTQDECSKGAIAVVAPLQFIFSSECFKYLLVGLQMPHRLSLICLKAL
jgi:hypothetical protein